jgi:hypothetical protein
VTQIAVYPDGRMESLAAIPNSAQAGEPEPAAPAGRVSFDLGGQVAGVGLEVFGSLGAQLGRLADSLEADRRDRGRPRIPDWAVTPLYIPETPIPLSSGAGSLDVRQLFGPTLGRSWVIYSAIARGFTAGTVQGLRNGIDLMLPFPAAGELTYGKCQKILRGNGERITWTATGITLATGVNSLTVSVAGLVVADVYWSDFAL